VAQSENGKGHGAMCELALKEKRNTENPELHTTSGLLAE
jgi:hypothetical protein